MADGTGSGRDRPLIATVIAVALLASPLLAVWAQPDWGWLAPYAVWAAILGVTALLLHTGNGCGDSDDA